jgi:3-phosphoshikimate 1-carboxyvinyltransferase
MRIKLNYSIHKINNSEINISGSKSESNRMLILKEFYQNIKLKNISNSKDTKALQKALSSKEKVINIGHAGTAMRFLTAYFSNKTGCEVTLTGSYRMQKRPIKILVDALIDLGATIQYVKDEGFPPLKIKGKKLLKNKLSIAGNVSSQYISALLLIAPTLKNGLQVTLTGKVTSRPYIEMTLKLLNKIGVSYSWNDNIITINHKKEIKNKNIIIESDWSSASYFYSFTALSKENSSITLKTFFKDSIQGDKQLAKIYENFGVKTIFSNNTITLIKNKDVLLKEHLEFDFNNTPDLAQTIAVTCVGLGISCSITGLHTLKIKETDRLVALKNELSKIGAKVKITNDSIYIKPESLNPNISIKTYNDHRMAMAFAPLSLLTSITIENPDVVVKSYPNFWKDIDKMFN